MAPRPTSPRRTTRAAAATAFMIVAAACGGAATTPSPDGDIAPVTTSIAAPNETAPPDPLTPDCSQARLSADLGELGYAACDGEWAAVQPRTYTDACIDCETIWLARWSGAAWGLRARCHALVVLTPSEHGCAAVAGTFGAEIESGDLREFPPAATACAIWGFNSVEESLATTGCTEQ